MTNAAKFASSLAAAGDWLGFTATSEQQKVTQKQSNMDQFSESSFRSQTCFLEGHEPAFRSFFLARHRTVTTHIADVQALPTWQHLSVRKPLGTDKFRNPGPKPQEAAKLNQCRKASLSKQPRVISI